MIKSICVLCLSICLLCTNAFAQALSSSNTTSLVGQFIFIDVQKEHIIVSDTLTFENDFYLPLKANSSFWKKSFPLHSTNKKAFLGEEEIQLPHHIKTTLPFDPEFEEGKTNLTFQYTLNTSSGSTWFAPPIIADTQNLTIATNNKAALLKFLYGNLPVSIKESTMQHDSVLYRSFTIKPAIFGKKALADGTSDKSKLIRLAKQYKEDPQRVLTIIVYNLPLTTMSNWIVAISIFLFSLLILVFFFYKKLALLQKRN